MAFDRARAQQSLIRLAKAGPGRLRGPVGRATRRFRGEFAGPLVTVVLPVSDDDTTRIGTCLDSLKVQTYRNLEILVVRFGRHDRVTATVREHAAGDWRIKTRLRVERSLAAARNAGVAAASGELVVVVTHAGDDFVHTGIERLVEAHHRSNSPLVVGAMREPDIAGWIPDSAYDAAHHTPVRGTTLAATPVAVTDLGLGNKLFTRTSWRQTGVRFTDEFPDGADVALALLEKASAVDLLADFTYIPTERRDGVQVGTVPDVLSGLAGWIDRNDHTWHRVEALGLPEVRDWFLWGVLDTAVQPLIADVERADESQWQTLRDHVAMLLAAADEHVWARLNAESRVKLWLLQGGHRKALEDFLGARLFTRGNRPTEIRDGRVWALLPHHDDAELGIPRELFEMTADETRFRAMLREARWVDAATLELTIFAAIDFVHMTASPAISCALVDRDAGRRIPLEIRQFRDARANQALRRHQDFSWGAFDAVVPVADVVAAGAGGDGTATWVVEVDIDVDGVRRSGAVPLIDEQASAGFIGRDHLAPRPVAGSVVAFNPRSDVVGLRIRPDRGPRLRTLEVTGRTVSGVLDQAADGGRVTGLRATQGTQQVRAETTEGPDGMAFRLQLPAAWTGQRRWQVQALTADGREVALGWPAAAPQWLGVGTGEVVGSRTAAGDTELYEAAGTLVVDDIVVEGLRLDVTGHWLGAPAPGDARLALLTQVGGTEVLTAELHPGDDPGEVRASVTLTTDRWGLGDRPLAPAWLWLAVTTGDTTVRALLGERGIDRLHHFMVGTDHPGYSARVVQEGRVAGVELLPAVPVEERVPYGQTQLQEWYADGDIPLEPGSVYFQSYVGASATDSQLALHHELRRTRPELTLYWGVASAASWVPDGGVPVVMTTREWYRVLAAAGQLCMNIDPERWFRKRPGQRLLQTFHGYPSKSMGIRMWDAKHYPPRRIELELARTSKQWDLILTPEPDMDQYYRREYAYDGPIHSEGYPRDDVLVSDRADAVREDVRRRLGIAPHQKAILYAPTWRDDQATNWRAADAVHHLDIGAAARDLGPDYVLLLRGHRFHNPAGDGTDRAGATRFLDVTEYPEINDLILAADAAVLDYSSLRFDFALTRRPMVFLVPDLDTYVGGVRGFLYDYVPTAPGPHVDTADQVVDLLRDIDGLRRRYADATETFHRRFNRFMDGHAAERVAAAFFGGH
ncbi:bifunctional glycosyltransferase family 2 protein/CDP-glycerol:glycerophosphate glycerophosphotransferase [Nocardioides carbamazepini]|uniref:bifunctional glycosyltransferase family 2 protein/CDP-glycerol:glycerophosphate glycerophosphotransferase n=1 Tax=Nocardioides carbamazepini TaxID=2854259 RepID=UPI00214A79BA|nr:bifunctional glycosyltransferase family 2 protein/CDP-glycerol:glycerophosphate glycerophosphotransferase [Nocardioides carbamazepini]MCR1783557.1 bifunctional glycosyltransferase family 2 protein/CDP-glycerol:glycerophosphate glycerophosphotransferase [Nocardioides carbamazepini]